MLGLTYREQLPPIVAAELDALIARLQPLLNVNTGTVDGSESSLAALAAKIRELTARVDALTLGYAAVASSPQSPPGIDGEDGHDGEPGQQGSRGSQGAVGPIGPMGEVGQDGEAGDTIMLNGYTNPSNAGFAPVFLLMS